MVRDFTNISDDVASAHTLIFLRERRQRKPGKRGDGESETGNRATNTESVSRSVLNCRLIAEVRHDAEVRELSICHLEPAFVGGGAGGTGVQDRLHRHALDASVLQRHLRPLLCELADSDDRLHPQQPDDVAQRALADLVGGVALGRAQLWWCQVPARLVEEDQRTQVVHEALPEEDVRSTAQLPEETPEPVAANLQVVTQYNYRHRCPL